jgi:hypothetical protein
MNCAFDKEKLSGYYDGELEAAEKAEVERHIASCSECLRELGELKSAAILVKELPRLRAPRSLSEGIAREIQAAGKVHHFAKLRRNVLWACAAAAGVFVVLNVAYFVRMEKTAADAPPVAAKAVPPSIASVPPPAEKPEPEPVAKQQEDTRRGVADRSAREKERSAAAEERKNTFGEAKKEDLLRAEEPARKLPTDAPRPVPAPEKPAVARSAEPKPAGLPAPASTAAPRPPVPAAPAAPLAGKDDARPAEPPAEKAAGGKKDESLARDLEAKAKRAVDPQGEAAPTHFTLASTQLSKARPLMEQTLRTLGVKIPNTPPATLKGMSGKAVQTESTFALELTDSQMARLKQELEKSGHCRLVQASPGDPVLAQFGDTGLYRPAKKEVASGGAPTVKKAVEAPKGEASKAGALESKEVEKDGKESAEGVKANLEVGADKAGEPKRKIVLHLLDVPFMPETQPALDPVKK